MSNTNLITNQNAYFSKDFYDKQLLETAKTKLVHAKFGQKRSIPRNAGKRVEFRRYDLFTPDTEKLTLQEGVTPDGQTLTQSHVEAEVKQYGAYVEVSDTLDLVGYDQVLGDSTELLGEQLGNVVEWVTRDAMNAGTNVQYAGGKANRLSLTSSDKLTVSEIRKAVRTLKKAKARMFTTAADDEKSLRKPHFICICSPDATYDLQSDSLWQDVSKYSDAEAIYSGEIGRLFGVVFVESTEAKVFTQSVCTAVASHSANSADVIVDEITDAAEAYLVSGAKIKIGSTEYTVASCDKATKKITLSAAVSTKIDADTAVFSEDAGALDQNKKGLPVHSTLVFGADSYGVIDVEGSGCVQTIVKPIGSGGASDPLDQRATVGAKVAAYAAKILNNLWIVRIEHAVSI